MEQPYLPPVDHEAIDINHRLNCLGNMVNLLRQTATEQELHFPIQGEQPATVHRFFREIRELLQLVCNTRLGRWQHKQKLCSSLDLDAQLNEFQDWFNRLAELLAMIRDQCAQLIHLPNMQQCADEANEMFWALLESAVVIDSQPPQVLRTHSRFDITVRMLLTHGQGFGLHQGGEVRVDIVKEAEVQQMQANAFADSNTTSGEMLHNTGQLIELSHSPDKLCCVLKSVQLSSIRRSPRSAQLSVTDDKFALLITVRFRVEASVPIVVRKLSLPLVVTVHGSQNAHAWATILWDNAFAHPQRHAFQIADSGPWSQLAESLNAHFHHRTGRPLNGQQLHYLGEKLFGSGPIAAESPVSWSQFSKDQLAGRQFTFWDWFYAVIKLIRDRVQTEWQNDRVMGFVSRHQTEVMLSRCEPGTFLLRFQESAIGHISIAVVDRSQQVTMIELTQAEFTIHSLNEIIGNLNQCVYLYPGIPKSQAFPFNPVDRSPNNGYVRPKIHLTINDIEMDEYILALDSFLA